MLVKANVRKRILLSVVFAITASLLQVIYPQAFTPKATAAEVDTSTQGFVFDISLAPSRATGTQWRLYLSPTETGTATIDWPSSAAGSLSNQPIWFLRKCSRHGLNFPTNDSGSRKEIF